jgi:hypothetical protein
VKYRLDPGLISQEFRSMALHWHTGTYVLEIKYYPNGNIPKFRKNLRSDFEFNVLLSS